MKKPARILIGSLIFLFFVYAAGRAGDQYAQAGANLDVAPRFISGPVAATLRAALVEDGGASGEGNGPGRGATTSSGRVPAVYAGGTTRLLPSGGVSLSGESATLPDSPLSRAASRRAIRQVFGWGAHGDRAVKVSWCESRLYERTVSDTNDWGLFALHRTVWDPALNPRARPYWPRGTDWSDVFDPVVNARVAWAISKRGTDFWTHWKWSAGCWA